MNDVQRKRANINRSHLRNLKVRNKAGKPRLNLSKQGDMLFILITQYKLNRIFYFLKITFKRHVNPKYMNMYLNTKDVFHTSLHGICLDHSG